MKKRLVVLGDSISVGTHTAEGDKAPCSIADPNYAKLVSRALGYDELLNYAQNGTCISPFKGPFPKDAFLCKAKYAEKGDAVIVAGGTNDFTSEIPLGSLDDKTENTFMGAVNLLFEALSESYPCDKVYVITPIRRLKNAKNGLGLTLEDYRGALSLLVKKYGFVEIDGYGVPINPQDPLHIEKYMLDGLHPNTEGHRLYAEYVISRINAASE